jgi:hypothetical protein
MPADYSRRPLAHKLGIRAGQKLALLNPPSSYEINLGELPMGVTVNWELTGGLDLIQLFVKDRATLEKEFPRLKENIKQEGMIWVSWPKRSSKSRGDVDENLVRAIGLRHGLVDVKICAIDGTWSAMKFVMRVKDRR